MAHSAGPSRDGREGVAALPRTPLAWRLVGRASELPVVVFVWELTQSYILAFLRDLPSA